jgi:transketolase
MNKESLRGTYGKTLLRIGRTNPNIVVLDADLAKSTKTITFAKELSERFIDMGLSEQDMISTAAGISLTGKTVFASSFCIFLAGRAYDQVRQSVCYNDANVKLVGTHSGLGVGEDGATHQMLEDISLMRSLPRMRVIVPADAIETEQVIEYVAQEYGPFFVRLTRNDLPTVYDHSYQFKLGQSSVLRDGTDVALFAIGPMVSRALAAADMLQTEKINAAVINLSSIKPIDQQIICSYAAKTKKIVTIEDHSVFGGMGSAVAEVLSQNYPVKIKIMGVNNQFGRSGTPDELYKAYHLHELDIANEVKQILMNP